MHIEESISVVIPAYNEEGNIKHTTLKILEILTNLTDNYEIVIVNDASKDKTLKEINSLIQENKNIRIIQHQTNMGLNKSLRDGFSNATKDLILYTDADLPVDPAELKTAIFLLRKENADVISAYPPNRNGDIFLRNFYSIIYNILIRCVYGTRFKDINFAFKLFKRKILNQINLSSEGKSVFIGAELLIKSKVKGFKVIQFRTSYSPRKRWT